MWLPKMMIRFVLSIIKLYSFHLFSVVPKKASCWKYRKWCSYFENFYHTAKIVNKKRINFLVSLYCIWLFSRIKISQVFWSSFVSVHCNCLIGCILIARGYRPGNTDSTTADICFLVKNSNKNTKTKCNVC